MCCVLLNMDVEYTKIREETNIIYEQIGTTMDELFKLYNIPIPNK